jgi:dihydrolipoamide dehydrogenase
LSKNEIVDVVVIGGGPGGYTAAERVAQLDGKVMLVEKNKLGGTCLNKGCFPTAILLRSGQVFTLAKMANQFGVKVGEVSLDFETIIKNKDELIGNLVAGTERRLRSAGVNLIKGKCQLAGSNTVEISNDEGFFETIKTRNIIIATGSKPLELNIPVKGGKGFIMAEEALSLKKLPKTIAVIGCDYIGVQIACIFNLLGADVTIIESGPQLLPNEDEEITAILQELLKAYGIKIFTEAETTNITVITENEKKLTLKMKERNIDINIEEIILSKGRVPNINELNLEKANITKTKTGIIVDKHMRTNIPNIYAIGDAVGKFMFAHVAMAESLVAAESAMGKNSEIEDNVMPRYLFSNPELAAVGLTERQAMDQGYKVDVARIPLELNGFAHILRQTEGLVKIVSEAEYGQVLGMHILGPNAGNLINEAALGIRLEARVEDMAKTLRVHPSLGEVVRDAAQRLYSPIILQ